MKIILLKNILPVAVVLFFMACNLSKEVDIDLPTYDRQPVVECYLEPGKPFRLLLSQSYAFFDKLGLDSSFLQKTLLDGAFVTIRYNGQTDTLKNQLSFEPNPIKLFNYIGQNIVPEAPGTNFDLYIRLANGGEITSTTQMITKVPIDSIGVDFSKDADSLARVLMYITDDKSTDDFYRRLLNYHSLDSFPEQDFILTDAISESAKIVFGTGYELKEGDTVYNAIFHVTPAYYKFVESVQLAVSGNLNPFAQPSPIKSNVQGSANPLGIFAPLVYDRRMTIIKR